MKQHRQTKKRKSIWLGFLLILLIALGAAGLQKSSMLVAKEKKVEPKADSILGFRDTSLMKEKIGVADFDKGANYQTKPGFLDEADAYKDRIIRSYDSLEYTYSVSFNASDGQPYTDLVVRLSGKVINGVTDDGRMLNAQVSPSFGGIADLSKKESTFSFDLTTDAEGNKLSTATAPIFTIPVEVYGATNGTKLGFEAQAQIVSAKNDKGETLDLSNENIVVDLPKSEEVTVTSDVNLKVWLADSSQDSEVSFKELTGSNDYPSLNVKQFGLAVGVVPLNGRGTKMLGSSVPESEIYFEVSQSAKFIDLTNGDSKILEIGKDVQPMGVFDYGYVGYPSTYSAHEKTLSFSYPNYLRLNTGGMRVPNSKFQADRKRVSVYNSGSVLAEDNQENTLKMMFGEYDFNVNYLPETYAGGGLSSVYTNYEQLFASMGMLLTVPIDLVEEYTQVNWTLKVESIKFKNEKDIEQEIIPTGNTSQISWSEVLYPPGGQAVYTRYFGKNGEQIQTQGGVSVFPEGDAKASVQQQITVNTALDVSSGYTPLESTVVQKWNPNESTVVAARYTPPKAFIGNTVVSKPIKYGVSKTKDYSLLKLNENRIDDYEWYDSIKLANEQGEVSAVMGGSIGKRTNGSREILFVDRIVKNNIGVADSNGDPFVSISFGTTFLGANQTNAKTYPDDADITNYFEPTEYDDRGIVDLQKPNERYGDTLLVVPYVLSIGKKAIDGETGKEQSTFPASETINWVLSPRVITDAVGELEPVSVTVKDVLPKGMNYLIGSGKQAGESFEPQVTGPNAKGETTLTWTFDTVPGQVIPDIQYQTQTNQDELTFNGQSASVTNHAVISSPLVNSAESLRSKDYTVSLTKVNTPIFTKSTSTTLIDANDVNTPIRYLVRLSNQTELDFLDVDFLDVLPFIGDGRLNGVAGSDFHGSYKLVGLKVLQEDQKTEDPSAIKYYTNQEIDPKTRPGDIDVSDWESYTNGNLKADVQAVYARIPTLAAKAVRYLEILILPEGSQPEDVYFNRATANASNYATVMETNVARTTVVNRKLSGQVWYDDNYNGRMDDNEPFRADVPVTLYQVNADDTRTKVTENLRGEKLVDDEGVSLVKSGADGSYSFDALPAGDYVVGFAFLNEAGEDEIAENQLFITKPFEPNVEPLVNSKLSLTEKDGLNRLTPLDKKFMLPDVSSMNAAHYEEQGVNAGVLVQSDLKVKKSVYDSFGEDGQGTGKSLDGETVKVGDTLFYEIIVSNPLEHSIVENVLIQDQLPEGLIYKKGTLRYWSPETLQWADLDDESFNENQYLQTEALGSIVGPNQQIKVRFEAEITPEASGDLTNIATAKGVFKEKEFDEKDEVNNEAPPLPEIQKTVDRTDKVQVDDILTYTIIVSNQKGGGKWFKSVVTDTLKPYLDYVSGSTMVDGATISDDYWQGNKLTYPVGDLVSEEQREITFQAKVKQVPEDDGVVWNTAFANGEQKDGTPTDEVEDTVKVPAIDGVLHIRQVVLNPNDDLVIPSKGFFQLYLQENENKRNENGALGLVSGSTTKDTEAEVTKSLFTTRTIRMSQDENGIRIVDLIPEYYEYVGHIQTTDTQTVSQDHLSANQSLMQSGEIYLDYTEHQEYWVSVYIQPKLGKTTDGEDETLPRVYSWDYKTNQFPPLQGVETKK